MTGANDVAFGVALSLRPPQQRDLAGEARLALVALRTE
jgi:hypothetical protein